MAYSRPPRPREWLSNLNIRIPLQACALLISLLIIGAAANPVQAVNDENALVSNQRDSRHGKLELRESAPVIGQIFTTGGDRARYELTEIASTFGNTSRTHKFDLEVSLHLVTSERKPGSKVVEMTGNIRDRKTHQWRPASTTILEPNTRYMIVFRCNSGADNDHNCNGRDEEVEINLTSGSSEVSPDSDGWAIANDLYIEDDEGNASSYRGSARIAVKGRSAGVPHIVDNGVHMYDVNRASSGGWPIRVRGDDTYGKGELLAVSVEFSESISVDSETTFRIQMGTATRSLVPVSTWNETVIFATLVRSYDSDSDGVWIGDNTATLDHNDADAIQSTGDSPRNANLSHSSLGTQSNHKVVGNAIRPKIRSVRIASTPQYGDTYIRYEPIQIEAQFDRPVVVNGPVSAKLISEAFQQNVSRFANYTRGSGTSKLVFEYAAFLDVDVDGIFIPGNSLAKNGDLTAGVEGGGSIAGRSGGLLAELASSGRGEDPKHKVDARLAGVPEVMANVQWDWEADTPNSSSIEMDFNILSDPGHFSEDHALVLVFGWGHISGDRFAFGLRTDVDKPGTDGTQGKGIIFNRWGTADTSTYSRTTGDGWTETGDFGGPFISLRRSFDWSRGNYSVRIARDGDDDEDGRWFGMWITDKSTGVETKMGSVKFPLSDGSQPSIQARSDVFGSLMAITGESAINPSNIPVFEAALGLPDDSEGDPPNEATVNYSLLGRGITNANVRYDSDTGRVIMRVGGSTNKMTPAGTTLTGLEVLEVPQLTASAERVPSSHTGRSQFVFRLHFSEEFPLSYRTLRDSAFTVSGGDVVKASRVYRSSNMRWEIRIEPDGNGPVTIVLPATTDCSATGAICTGDGRPLSNRLEITVPRPGG